jgi:protein TonB
MFEDSLLESGRRFKTWRPVTTTLSFAVQSLVVGVLVVIPLFVPDALPQQHLAAFLVAPPPPPPAARSAATVPARQSAEVPAKVRKIVTEIDNNQLRTPAAIPAKIATVKDDEAPPPMTAAVIGGVTGGVPGGVPGGVLGGVLGNIASLPPPLPKPAAPEKLRVSSGVAAGNLIHVIQPQYPPLARQARIQGTVKLQAVIGKDGGIENLRVVSGHKMLAQAALDAVKQWRYKPYYLNGEPCEVEFEINVEFKLSGG